VNDRRYVVGITGASGVVMGYRLVQQLLKKGYKVDLVITHAGRRVLKDEMGLSQVEEHSNLVLHDIDNIGASIASGSVKTDGMIIMPCSMGTLAGIANGISSNLMQRAADVTIKEGRRLILVPRETPLSLIHIKNLLHAAQAGAVIIPPIPAFYTQPSTIDDVINFAVGKVLDVLQIEHELYPRYGE
jgi:4-hydroxy-3-polyprenylbenzoate decarboxylase